MANELSLLIRGSITNGSYTDSFTSSISVDQAALAAASGIQTVGTSAENLAVGDIAANGYLFMTNLDSTNFITFGPDSSGQVTVGKIKPGESCVFRLQTGVTLKLTADTAACKLKYLLLND